jgi:hypothetical protein
MYLFSILKLEGRRSGKDRRNTDNSKPGNPERRASADRRTVSDRRNYSERRTGIHHVLTEQQKARLERMYDFLEHEGLG